MYESKWGALIKVRHSPTNVPSIYVGSNRKYYASTDISGLAEPLCSGTRVLSAPNITGATYTWSVNSSLLTIVSGQGTSQLTVQRSSSRSGSGWVEVQISTPCSSGPSTSKKFNFWVGNPQSAGIISGSTYTYENTYTPYSLSAVNGATQYNWQFPSGWIGSGTISSPIAYTTVGPNSGQVSVTPQNACGSAGVSNIYVTVVSCPTCRSVDVWPNPADSYISVVPEKSDLQNGDDAVFELEAYYIIDIQGRLVSKVEEKSLIDPYSIEVLGLPKGIYVIHLVVKDRETITKRLVIDR